MPDFNLMIEIIVIVGVVGFTSIIYTTIKDLFPRRD